MKIQPAAMLLMLTVCTAPSAGQVVATPITEGVPGKAPSPADLSSMMASVLLNGTASLSIVTLKRASMKERMLQLNAEQFNKVAGALSAQASPDADDGVARAASYVDETSIPVPLAQGTSGLSFADTRAGISATAFGNAVRPAGKLFMNFGTGYYVCSASLIGKSLLVTAAHCVWDWGTKKWATNVRFVPNYDSASSNVQFPAIGLLIPSVYASVRPGTVSEWEGCD